MNRLIDPATEQSISSQYGTVQSDDLRDDSSGKSPRLLTVSYLCLIIVQTWLVMGLIIGYTSPVLSDLEGNGNSSAPLDKISYQDLFSVSRQITSKVHNVAILLLHVITCHLLLLLTSSTLPNFTCINNMTWKAMYIIIPVN